MQISRRHSIWIRSGLASLAILLTAALMSGKSMVAAATAEPAADAPWFRFSPAELAGGGLDPIPETESMPHEVPTGPLLGQRQKSKPIGAALFLIYQADAGGLNITGLPGDEFLQVIGGSAVFTDAAGKARTYRSGDIIVFPRAWQGTVLINKGYRELTVLPGSWAPALAGKERDNSGAPARAIVRIAVNQSTQACQKPAKIFTAATTSRSLCVVPVYDGDFLLLRLQAKNGAAYRIDATSAEQFMRVLSGSTTLMTKSGQQTFVAGDTFGVSAQFTGEWHFSKAYSGLLVTR